MADTTAISFSCNPLNEILANTGIDAEVGGTVIEYANYNNSGVVRADANGRAVLHFRNPSSYQVGLMHRTLSKHIHYRECRHPGMLSDIKTIKL